MYHPNLNLIAAQHAQAVALAQQVSQFEAGNLPSNRYKFLPANGAWLEGGNASTPGVNASYMQETISQGDWDNLRAGKLLYKFVPAGRGPSTHNHNVLVPGAWHAGRAAQASDVNEFFQMNPSATLVQVNQYLSAVWQKALNADHKGTNLGVLEFAVVVATSGYGASVDFGAAAASGAGADAAGGAAEAGSYGAAAGEGGTGAGFGDALVTGGESLITRAAVGAVLGKILPTPGGQEGGQSAPVQTTGPVTSSNNFDFMLPLIAAILGGLILII